MAFIHLSRETRLRARSSAVLKLCSAQLRGVGERGCELPCLFFLGKYSFQTNWELTFIRPALHLPTPPCLLETHWSCSFLISSFWFVSAAWEHPFHFCQHLTSFISWQLSVPRWPFSSGSGAESQKLAKIWFKMRVMITDLPATSKLSSGPCHKVSSSLSAQSLLENCSQLVYNCFKTWYLLSVSTVVLINRYWWWTAQCHHPESIWIHIAVSIWRGGSDKCWSTFPMRKGCGSQTCLA